MMRKIPFLALSIGLLVCSSALGQEKLPAGAKIKRLEAYPTAIKLQNVFDYRQLLLTAFLESGERIDVTRLAKAEMPKPLVSMTATGLVRPVANGSGNLHVQLSDNSLELPVTVSGQHEPYKVGFVHDIMPLMSRIGCNAGTCHGAQAGKNGFKFPPGL